MFLEPEKPRVKIVEEEGVIDVHEVVLCRSAFSTGKWSFVCATIQPNGGKASGILATCSHPLVERTGQVLSSAQPSGRGAGIAVDILAGRGIGHRQLVPS